MRNFYNKIKNMDKRYKKAACVLLLAIGVIVTGISFAYFTSRDEVTNHLAGHSYLMEVVLTEPEWSSSGYDKAQEIVPGMEIAKDPYVTNMMTENAYIRLKLEFVVDKDKDGTYETTIDHTDESETLTLFDYYYESNAAKENKANGTSLIDSTNKGYTYSRLLSTVYYNTKNGTPTCENADIKQHLVNVTSGITSNNPYFYYKDGWFYYLADKDAPTKSEDSLMKKMAYKGKTEYPLFTDVKLPVMKDEYNDLFANGFKINVVVQAVDADLFKKDGKEYTPRVSDTITVFEEKFPESTTTGE